MYCSNNLVTLVLVVLVAAAPSAHAIRRLRIVSPLQALTIWDPELSKNDSWRNRFLPKFKAGLQAEVDARKEFSAKASTESPAVQPDGSKDWAARAQAAERAKYTAQEKAAEAAYDKAVALVEMEQKQQSSLLAQLHKQNPNQYQFVGVVQPSDSVSAKSQKQPIVWYARKKPSNAKWSLRLLHVNKRAVVKDLFDQGHLDVFAKYRNTGKVDQETGTPIISREYKIRQRSIRNLWNFSPKHFFTDSSGMYWRERRVQPGLYTDGKTVYESSYRYMDGRNGMHKYSSFQEFVKSKSVEQKRKDKIFKRLKEDAPDIVLEEV
eukprot:CAMPEP_0198145656 /NCGR_PEP_ID=MMETSP1443-20131203/24828_1 /TAXON_ID=186043 /ORGANISM="Entomoneis sp., Strain CCMP2396" /LENGTH=320 /DNA_ID=CAMNT_0043809355 /DNA_START=55 /DNA_END=1017 /DNA_ORIENTATION=-